MHHFGRTVGPAQVVIAPGSFHVRFVVEALEAIERKAVGQLLNAWSFADLLDRLGTVPEKRVEFLQESVGAARKLDPGIHIGQQAERIVPFAALVVGRIDQQPSLGVEGLPPLLSQTVQLSGQLTVAHAASHDGCAETTEREVQGVGDGMYYASAKELLPVLASQVSIHVTQRPVPVDVRDVQLAEVSQKGVCEGASLMEEAVGALGHPITDRQVALLLADGEQRVGQLNCPIREDGGDQ